MGAIAVHGVNGFFGTFAVGFFAIEGGLFYGGGTSLLITQILGVTTIALFSFTVTFIVMKFLKFTIGIRISSEDEEAGIDATSFGVQSYNNE